MYYGGEGVREKGERGSKATGGADDATSNANGL